MPREQTPFCDCGARLLWAVTEAGALMPLDPQPNPDGNVAAIQEAHGGWICRVLGKNRDLWPGERRYMPHWATCSMPEKWRKKSEATPRRRSAKAAPQTTRLF